MKQFSLPVLIILINAIAVIAQPCTYLAYEGFEYDANVSLNGLGGGTGWAAPWYIQNSDTSIPGYQIHDGMVSLAYNDLPTLGRYSTGGRAYLTSGRALNTDDNGPFSDYIAAQNNLIGSATGDTLWVSFVLNKLQNNNEVVAVDLHNSNIAWCTNCADQLIGVGYFGTNHSNVGNERRWSLRLNNDYYPTIVPVSTNTPTFFVLRIVFEANQTNIALYVNPVLGDTPPTPSLSQNTVSANTFRSVAFYGGSSPSNGALDELRFASSYPCVAPDSDVLINLPPNAAFSTSTNSGSTPLTISFNGTTSSDPENSILNYLWDFGDGSPSQTGAIVEHTYDNIVGQITATLTVTDELGLQSNATQTITLLDENNTFPCQSTFTVLNMPTCSADDGRLQVNIGGGITFELRNGLGSLLNTINGNQYHNLSPGIYQFTASGGQDGCRDTFQLYIERDSATCPGWQPNMCNMRIGTNLSGFADWSVEKPMRNLLKHVRNGLIPYTATCNCWDAGVLNEIAFDNQGYPTHLPQITSAGNETYLRMVISSDDANLVPGETYVLLYDGDGVIQPQNAAINSSVAGRIEFMAGSGNVWLHLIASNQSNPIRNFRLLRLADENVDLAANPFYDMFKDKIAPFNTLRFMDWGATNNNPVVYWSDRTTIDYFTYAMPTGVPYEVMIELANQMQKNVWICVPHLADENYVAQMATLFKNTLDSNLTIYLEYSNEVWNWIFAQAQYNNQNRPSNLNYARAYAEKAKKIFQIWHNVFGTDKVRVKRVLGIQVLYNALNEQILAQLNQEDWDLGSPTHYFGLNHSETGNPILNGSSTAQDIINNARNAWYQSIPQFRQDYNQIKLFGKPIVTYEGGQHFVGNVFGIPYDYQNAMWEAQYSMGMYDLYNEVLDTIRAWGCELATHFSLAGEQESVYGSWGALSHIDLQGPYLQTAPKYQVLLDNICNEPVICPTLDNVSLTLGTCNTSTNTYVLQLDLTYQNAMQMVVWLNGEAVFNGMAQPSVSIDGLLADGGVGNTLLVHLLNDGCVVVESEVYVFDAPLPCDCPILGEAMLELTGEATQNMYQATQTIASAQIITEQVPVTYRAGNQITLTNGFTAIGNFTAYITSCTELPLLEERMIPSVSSAFELSLLPNPAMDFVQIKALRTIESPLQLVIFNTLGKVLLTEQIPALPLGETYDLSLRTISAGKYWLRAMDGITTQVYSLIVIKE